MGLGASVGKIQYFKSGTVLHVLKLGLLTAKVFLQMKLLKNHLLPSMFCVKLKTSSSLSPGIRSHYCVLMFATQRICIKVRRERERDREMKT